MTLGAASRQEVMRVLETTGRKANTTAQESSPQERRAGEWWALGDAPVRVAETLVPLVDGRAAMLAMCAAFLRAQRSIRLADWGMYARLRMVRGTDQRAGPDGSEEQYALIDRLRAAGLGREAIALWESGNLRVVDVLGFAVRRGVDVRVLLWGPFNPRGMVHIINDPAPQARELRAHGVTCRLDRSSRSPLHVAQSLHQKLAVVDGEIAFVGGVDLTVERNGDFDRWDAPAHPLSWELRNTALGPARHPWHDAHLMLTGEPAKDVQRNFDERWEESDDGLAHRVFPPLKELAAEWLEGRIQTGKSERLRAEAGEAAPGAGPDVPGPGARVQVVRTIPALTYRFAPAGIHSLAQAYILAMRQAKRFIFLESQYLWLEGFDGLNIWRLGWQSPTMKALLEALAEAAEGGATVGIVLPDHPNAGRPYTDDTIAWLRGRAPRATAANRIRVFTLATSACDASGEMRYLPIYVHAKVGIVDDRWATIGSANLNSRGISHDAEMNVAVLDGDFARGLRRELWSEHLGLLRDARTGWPSPAGLPLPRPLVAPGHKGLLALTQAVTLERPPQTRAGGENVTSDLEDGVAGIQELARRAEANIQRLCRGEELEGQLLPYLLRGEEKAYGLMVHPDSGYLDPMHGERTGTEVIHTGQYI